MKQVTLAPGEASLADLAELTRDESALRLDGCARPEFDHWKWVSYWHPAREVIYFKREVYRRALKELAPLLYGN